LEELLYSNPEIKYVEAWNGSTASVINADGSQGNNLSFVAVPNKSTLIKPIMIGGRWLDPRDQNAIALNDGFNTQYPNLKVGDTITLKLNNKNEKFVVVGFFKLAGQAPNRSAVYRVVAKSTLDSSAQKDLATNVQSLLEANKFKIGSITTGSHINDEAANGFGILTTFLLILAILIALVGSIGLTGTMSMNIMERTREIGIMRSIGASDRELTRMVLIEGLIVGWLSWLLGAILSFPISAILSNSITLSLFGSQSSLGFSATGFIIWFVLVSILSVAASITPARSATRLTIREVLSYE
jgi:putative ABC transport system permease protein